MTDSCNKIKKQNEIKLIENNVESEIIVTSPEICTKPVENNNNNNNNLREEKKYLVNKLKNIFEINLNSDKFLNFNKKEKIEFLFNFIKSEEKSCKNALKILPDDMLLLIVASNFEGDCGRTPDEKPNWLDMEKFKRGQKFAMDYFFAVSYAQLLSLFILFSFEDGLKPLIFTGKSSTPYTAFKRYISTAKRVRNWYTKNPWKEGTEAYNDIQTVRKMHSIVREKLQKIDNKTIDELTKIKNPHSPSRDILRKDFHHACPEPSLGQCPFLFFQNKSELNYLRPKGLNQGDMVTTQFAFMGLVILYPKNFGIFHNEENLDAFCHTWRGIGYLLGIDDETLYQYACQLPGVGWLLNLKVNTALDNALNYSAKKHEELKRSEETWKKN
ncbi:uncharacterized protein LOC127286717 isoform X2 [Leptopilina boulardi]|uniref:uncharacterized protein LOC127286717 isoform X2 n=1 Tax=Leptopilina boulardi TaxID=63433 RepID=UPI0021F5265A|nr:uncharacterized protein LOC127286717 isoform X2 [Leptopilina boulardi]